MLIALIDCLLYWLWLWAWERPSSGFNLMLVGLLVLVITGIMDLDRPRRGLITVSQASMVRLQGSTLHQVVP